MGLRITSTLGGLLVGATLLVPGVTPERKALADMIDPIIKTAEILAKPVPPVSPGQATTPPTEPANVSASPAVVDASVSPPRKGQIPGSSTKLEPAGIRLAKLIEETRAALYKAGDAAQRRALQAQLRQTLAADTSLTDKDLIAEEQRIRKLFVELHAGEQRVYPGQRTMETWESILQAIKEALLERRKGRPSPLRGQ